MRDFVYAHLSWEICAVHVMFRAQQVNISPMEMKLCQVELSRQPSSWYFRRGSCCETGKCGDVGVAVILCIHSYVLCIIVSEIDVS